MLAGILSNQRYHFRINLEYIQTWDEKFVLLFNFLLRKICIHFLKAIFHTSFLNPFVLHVPFLYSLKISESLTVLWCFQRVEKGCIGNKWVTVLLKLVALSFLSENWHSAVSTVFKRPISSAFQFLSVPINRLLEKKQNQTLIHGIIRSKIQSWTLGEKWFWRSISKKD